MAAGTKPRALGALAVVLASCIAAPAVATPSSSSPSLDVSALRATLETRFGSLGPGQASPGSIWSADRPITLEPLAFGTFPPDRQPGGRLTFDRVRLATELPTVPDTAVVAVVGSYNETWKKTVADTVSDPSIWDVVPLYSSVSSTASLGSMPSGWEAAQAILQRNGLLLPDMEPHPHPRAGRFEFIRRLDGLPIFTNNGVSLRGLVGGSSQALARRRPILAVSRYPVRRPSEAWSRIQAGRGQTMYVDDGAPLTPIHLSEFIVTSIELVYLELQVLAPRELMQPYYAFRDSDGSILYVPAVSF